VWLELCITGIKRGVEECRHRYHVPEVPNALFIVTAEAHSYNNTGRKASARDNKEGAGG